MGKNLFFLITLILVVTSTISGSPASSIKNSKYRSFSSKIGKAENDISSPTQPPVNLNVIATRFHSNRVKRVANVADQPTPPTIIQKYRRFSSKTRRAAIVSELPTRPSINLTTGFLSNRIKRATNDDDFSTIQTRISTLARVINGITLYNGLVDDTITSDEAIAELMNIESISLEDLEKFDKTKVDSFVGKLEDIGGKMDSKSANVEKSLVDLHTIKDMWSKADDLEKLPSKEQFDELKMISSLELKDIEDFSIDTTLASLEDSSTVSNVKSTLEALAKSSKDASTEMNGKNVLTTLTGMKSFHQFVQLLEFYENSATNNLHGLSSVQIESVKKDIELLEEFKHEENSFISIMNAIVSNSMSTSIDRQYTSGFVEGFQDLKKLSTDLDDTWLLKMIGPLEIKDGMNMLIGLEKDLRSLDEKWKSVGTPKTKEAIRKATHFETHLKTVQNVSPLVEKTVEEFKKCPNPISSKQYTENMKKMSRNARILMRKVEAINSIHRLTEEHLNVITTLDGSKDESIQMASKLIESLRPYLQGFKNGQKIKEVIDDMMLDPTFFTEFKTNSIPVKYTEFFNCVKGIQVNTEGISKAAELTIQIRDLKITEFSTEIETASTAIAGSTSSIQSIRASIDSIKNDKSDKMKKSELEGLQKYSKPLGDSSSAMVSIQKALDKKDDLLKFIKNGHLVDDSIERLSSMSSIQYEIKTKWPAFDEVRQKSTTLLEEIQKRKDGVMKPKDDSLEAHGHILEGLAGLNDVDLQVKKRLIVIEQLVGSDDQAVQARIQPLKPELEELKTTVEKLAPLDLKFSRFKSLSGMSSTMSAVAGVFTKFHATSTVPIETSSASNSLTTEMTAMPAKLVSNTTTTEPAAGGIPMEVYYGGGGGFVALVLASVLAIWLVCCCYYKKCVPSCMKKDKKANGPSGKPTKSKSKGSKSKETSKSKEDGKKGSKSKESGSATPSSSGASVASSHVQPTGAPAAPPPQIGPVVPAQNGPVAPPAGQAPNVAAPVQNAPNAQPQNVQNGQPVNDQAPNNVAPVQNDPNAHPPNGQNAQAANVQVAPEQNAPNAQPAPDAQPDAPNDRQQNNDDSYEAPTPSVLREDNTLRRVRSIGDNRPRIGD